MDLKEQLNELKDKALVEFKKIKDSEVLWQLEKKYLGRNGELAKLAKEIKDVAAEQKPVIGEVINDVKSVLQDALDDVKSAIGVKDTSTEQQAAFDPTLPGKKPKVGRLHPMTQLKWQLEDIFRSLGFGVVEGPELESEWYNFEALNIPKHHPARDAQDTFYIKNTNSKKRSKDDNRLVLRTHTSPVQIRAMERYGAPLKIIVPGRAYRNEATDARHETNLWQVEGLVIDRDISVAHLKGTMDYVIDRLLGAKTRWRPGYFPFTEPSLEMDIECLLCKSKGCRVCKYTGWLEFMGSGLVHPNVLKAGGIDPEEFSGFAFGFGPERLHMLKYGVDDIRYYKNGDLRFLSQF
jgi:phenylalanyl-tRNA synthetase alpha chain